MAARFDSCDRFAALLEIQDKEFRAVVRFVRGCPYSLWKRNVPDDLISVRVREVARGRIQGDRHERNPHLLASDADRVYASARAGRAWKRSSRQLLESRDSPGSLCLSAWPFSRCQCP